jgi:6,7-dimethyl-8-ribityllumazine synthase
VAEIRGELAAVGRIAIVVSRYHERVTLRLLEGARRCCALAAIPDECVDVVWVPGAFELGAAAAALARTGRYAALVALGAVVRGETPHFEFVAAEATRALGAIARALPVPVGFGVLTVDTLEQALDRAGGPAGNKGFEAAEAAIRTADVLRRIGEHGAPA